MATDNERELLQSIRGNLYDCAGFESDVISRDRKRALDYYFQRQRGDEVRGRSNVVSGDLSAMVEANLAQMLDAFSGVAIAEFDATGLEDDDQAMLESVTVSNMIMRDNNGYIELGQAIKDALLQRNGFVKAWVEETSTTETKELKNASVEAIAELQAAQAVEVDVLAFDPEEKTATLRITTTVRRFRCESIPPENFLYIRDWHKIDLQEIPFCAERHVEPRSELLRRGFPKRKVNQLKPWNADYKTDSMARDVQQYQNTRTPIDDSQDLIEWYECYALVDSGNGLSERRRISVAGISQNSLLENVPTPVVNYATGSAFINSHRLTGVSLFDKLKQTQDITTGLERALMDNVNTVIKNRTAYLDGKVNVDDLDDGRPNGDIRVRASVGDVRTAIMNFTQQDLSGGILANLEHQKTIRTELGGASLDLATGQMQLAGGRIGSEGVDRAFSVMEQLASHMTKNMAQSLIRNTFLLSHQIIRAWFDTPVNVKVNGRWQSPTPSEWKPRTAVTVKVGMSPGERARKSAALGKVLDSQFTLAQNDMDEVLVNIEGFYRALTDWGRTNDLPNPEQYFVDPTTDASIEALKRKDAARQQNQAAQRALMSQAVGLEQLRAALDKYKQDTDLQFKYFAEILGAEIAEAEIVGKATADLVAVTKFDKGKKGNGKAGQTDETESTETESE